MNPGAGGFDISSLTRQMPAIPAGHQPQHHLHHHAANFGHQPQHQPLHQPMHQPLSHHAHHHHHHMQQTQHQHLPHPHPLLLSNMGLSPGLHHQTGPLPGHPVHHLQAAAGDGMHHFSTPAHVLHHQASAAQPLQQQPLLHPSPVSHQPHLSHNAAPAAAHSPQSLSSPHHPAAPTAVPPAAARLMSEATNGLASSVNLSSIQSLVDVLVDLPLPSESPDVVSAASRLITPEQQANLLQLSADQQHSLCPSLAAAMRNAKDQVSQMNLTFKPKRLTRSSASDNESSGATHHSVKFSSNHTQNSYMLSVLQQMDALRPNAAVPPADTVPAVRTQNQYWSPWSGTETGQQQQLLPPNSPFVSSPSYPIRGSVISQTTAVYNDNSNSSSSFSADPVTPSAMVTPPSHQQQSYPPQQQVHNQQAPYHQTVPLQTHNEPEEQQTHQVDKSNFKTSERVEPVVLLERSEEMEMALQEYYASNGSNEKFCPPSLADRVKSNKRQRSNSSHSKSEKRENKTKSREQSEPKSSPSPIRKQPKTSSSSSPSKSSSSNHYISSYEPAVPQLTTSLSSSLPPFEKFDAILNELFELGKDDAGKKKKKKTASSSDDSEDEVKTNGDSGPSLFHISIDSNTLAQLVGVTAKLKKSHQMQSAPVSKISTLLTALTEQLSVQSAGLRTRKAGDESAAPAAASDDEVDEERNITNSASLMHKFESCCDTCLVALYILSSKGMPSRVYLEECIEQIVAFLNMTIQQFTTIGASTSSPSKSKSKSPKKSNSYISPTTGSNKKILAKMYTKWSELIGLLVELLATRCGKLTDTLVLSTTRLALGAFFLENLNSNSSVSSFSSPSNEIQLNALRLTTTIFSQYPSHRGVILDELLQSIARLPTSKRNRVIYKVDGEDGSAPISMFTALLQQLIQSLFVRNENAEQESAESEKPNRSAPELKAVAQSLKHQYDAALKVAFTFLNTFLRKCCGLAVGGQAACSSDGDYRILFEGLVSDLMVTLHKPNWPAAQLLTQVLVKILITNITTTAQKGKNSAASGTAQAHLNLKLASLDHLGTICSRFAKELSDVEGVKHEVKTSLNTILTEEPENGRGGGGDGDDSDGSGEQVKRKKRKKRKSSRNVMDFLGSDEKMLKEIWKHLIRYCDEEKMQEQKNLLASIWLKEMEREMEVQSNQNRETEDGESNGLVSLSNQEQLEAKVKAFMNLYATAANPNLEEDEYHVIDSKTAELIIRYLDISQSTTVKLFDSALGHTIAALSGTSNTTMRSRSMKSLSNILNHAKRENATALLARSDLQRAMKSALLDASTSVREATIDLIGKFILSAQSEELVDKYYDIISERVLDTGVSVRKRVIKILRDICLEFPSYRKVPDICAKIIKRVNDDGEGIRKLVTETFTSMWFKEEKDRESILLKVKSINHVVATVLSDKVGTEWLQQLLQNLFAAQNDQNKKKTVTELALEDEDDSKSTLSEQQLQQVTSASSQIIEVLVSEILCGDSGQANGTQRKSEILSAMTTIWLFSKVCPHLLLNHISTLHPHLSTRCATQLDIMILSKVVQIIELVLPKLSNPSESLLEKIEADLTKNILQNNATVVGACVSCLSAVIHKHSDNQTLAQELFQKFFNVLDNFSKTLSSDPDYLKQPNVRPRLLRALFTCGLFIKHFSFLQQKEQLYRILTSIVRQNQATENLPHARDSDVLLKALTGLGFMFERNPEFSLRSETTEIYRSILRGTFGTEEYREMVQCQVLKNMTNYLSDEFNSEMNSAINWSKENLKSMSSEDGDANSQQSSIIQRYLTDILNCTLSSIIAVRRAAVNVIHIIHNGGHVHPLQLVPYLIAMSSDDDVNIRFRADHVLNEIERKYHGYVSMKSKVGVHLSYLLHSHSGRRGYRIENVNQSAPTSAAAPNATPAAEDKLITGRLATLYAVVANNRQSRRAFISSLLKYFDMIGDASSTGFSDVMTNISIGQENMDQEDQVLLQQFVCDNIVWLPYTLWDEPLYILTQLDLNLSILASNIQSQFKNILSLTDDDEDALDAKEEAKADAPLPQQADAELPNHEPDPADQSSRAESGGSFISDLKSYIPKPMPSFVAVADLVKVLRAYYMLMWCKHIVRELFAINDLKVQDYSPTETAKVWEKVVHRRIVDIRTVDKLMSYPRVLIDVEKMDEDLRSVVIAEYQRFKDVQLTGMDRFSKPVAQILREPPGEQTSGNKSKDFSQMREHYEPPVFESQPAIPADMREELMRRIRAQENHCSVSLETISDKEMKQLMQEPSTNKQNNDHPALKIRISKNSLGNDSDAKKKRKKKDKKKKKKRHHKRIDSDSDDESMSETSEDSDEDPDY